MNSSSSSSSCTCTSIIDSNNFQKNKPITSCIKRIDGVAARLVNGVATAFFASLERCSCMYLDTKDDSDHDDLPLIKNNQDCVNTSMEKKMNDS